MKQIIVFLIILTACGKSTPTNPIAQRCGWVAHKYYQNPPMDTTIANRTYWLQWVPDTVCPPGNPNCGIYYNIQVPKSCWDTMLPAGVSATRYCQ